MKQTQPLSACCKAPLNKWFLKLTGLYACSKCNNRCDIATPAQTIKAQTVSGTSVNISSTKNIPTQNIATPDTEDELEKEIEFIVNPQPELSEMLEGNFTKLFKQLQKDLIRKLIRTEKLKVEKAYGGCHKCYGKGYATYRYGYITSPDFIGDKAYVDPMQTHMNFCSCDRGKQLKELVTAERERILEAVKLEKKTSNVLPAYTDGWNAAINYLNAIREKIKKNI